MQMKDQQAAIMLAPVVVLGIIAMATSVAVGSAMLSLALGAAAILCAAGAAFRVTMLERTRLEAETPAQTVAQVAAVRSDRRRPTFDRETGLLAEWYFRLRFEEEIARAKRYGHALTAMTVTVSGAEAVDTARLAARAYLRQVDFAGDLSGVIGICLPDTSKDAAQKVVDRMNELVAGIQVTTREYPADGATLSALLNEHAWHTTADDGAQPLADQPAA